MSFQKKGPLLPLPHMCIQNDFFLWKLHIPCSLGFHSVEKSSSDNYKIFPFEDAGEYMMILSICGCTVPLNVH